MRVRTILKSLLFAYALTGVALLLLAFLLFTFDLGETAVDIGIIVVYVFACFMGGFMAGKITHRDKFLYSKGALGHESGTCGYYIFHVCGRWNTWWNAVVKKSFQN
mgnify:CR=1 FL=1